ncbi:hypothetical protein RRG08_057180 [Elysia crispata]|uniref:Uncharacterized protein n=1 Tax=Elysia crispata TaxID=231223 RepID=A0AAE1CNA3_9GAST|nr:hypothetical protein RRG08_057180 [Elysia crispata]
MFLISSAANSGDQAVRPEKLKKRLGHIYYFGITNAPRDFPDSSQQWFIAHRGAQRVQKLFWQSKRERPRLALLIGARFGFLATLIRRFGHKSHDCEGNSSSYVKSEDKGSTGVLTEEEIFCSFPPDCNTLYSIRTLNGVKEIQRLLMRSLDLKVTFISEGILVDLTAVVGEKPEQQVVR